MLKRVFNVGKIGLVGVVLNFLLIHGVRAMEIEPTEAKKYNENVDDDSRYLHEDELNEYSCVNDKDCLLKYSDGGDVYCYGPTGEFGCGNFEKERRVNVNKGVMEQFLSTYDISLVEEYNKTINDPDYADMVKELNLTALKVEDIKKLENSGNIDIKNLENSGNIDVKKLENSGNSFIKFKDARKWFERQQFLRLFSSFGDIFNIYSKFFDVWEKATSKRYFSENTLDKKMLNDFYKGQNLLNKLCNIFFTAGSTNKAMSTKELGSGYSKDMFEFFKGLDELFIKSYFGSFVGTGKFLLKRYFDSLNEKGVLCDIGRVTFEKLANRCLFKSCDFNDFVNVMLGYVKHENDNPYLKTKKIYDDGERDYGSNFNRKCEYDNLCIEVLNYYLSNKECSSQWFFDDNLLHYFDAEGHFPVFIQIINFCFEMAINAIFDIPRALDSRLFEDCFSRRFIYIDNCNKRYCNRPKFVPDKQNRYIFKLKSEVFSDKIKQKISKEGILPCLEMMFTGNCLRLMGYLFERFFGERFEIIGMTDAQIDFVGSFFKFFMDSKSEKNFYLLSLIYLINMRKYINNQGSLKD